MQKIWILSMGLFGCMVACVSNGIPLNKSLDRLDLTKLQVDAKEPESEDLILQSDFFKKKRQEKKVATKEKKRLFKGFRKDKKTSLAAKEQSTLEPDDVIGQLLAEKETAINNLDTPSEIPKQTHSKPNNYFAPQNDKYKVVKKEANGKMSVAAELEQEQLLRPRMRGESLDSTKYSFLVEDLLSHFKLINVREEKTKKKYPRSITKIGLNQQLGFMGVEFLAVGLEQDRRDSYSVIRAGKDYYDPVTKEFLGKVYKYIGEAQILQQGKVSKLEVTQSTQALEKGDNLIEPMQVDFPRILNVYPIKGDVSGYIVGQLSEGWDIGQYSSVIVNVGARDGVQVGDLLEIERASNRLALGKKITKKEAKEQTSERVLFSKVGEVLVYQVFSKLSLGLVIKSEQPLFIYDIIRH